MHKALRTERCTRQSLCPPADDIPDREEKQVIKIMEKKYKKNWESNLR